MAAYNRKIDDHPILGICVGFIPIIIYELFRLKTNVWFENNGLTAAFVYGVTGIFMLLVCFYSGRKLWKGDRKLNYQLPFYALIILIFVVADIKKIGHRRETSPVVFYTSQADSNGEFYPRAVDITFRENGSCRFVSEAGTYSEMFLETEYIRNGNEFTIEIPKNMTGFMPAHLELIDNTLVGEIHYNHRYEGTKVYYRTHNNKVDRASIFNRTTNKIEY